MKPKFVLCVLALVLLTLTAQAASLKNQYQAAEIQQFEVNGGIKFPDDYLTALNDDLLDQLQKLNTFQDVRLIQEAQTQTPAMDERTIRIAGKITEYKPGSKTARFLFGMLAGTTKVKAHIQIFDAASGALLLEDDVDGHVTYWSPDQDSKGATQGLAKEVAKVLKKKFF